MSRHTITPHSIGWSKAAVDAVKKARAKHKQNRMKKPFEIILKNSGELRRALWNEIKHPTNWLNPVKLFMIWPIRGGLMAIGFVTGTTLELLKARKESLDIKKAAMTNVGYTIVEEMKRDPAFKKIISDLVNERKLRWLYVDGKGQILLSKNSKIPESYLDDPMKKLKLPRVDMEEMLKYAKTEYVDAVALPSDTLITIYGNEVRVSILAKGARQAKEEILKKTELRKIQIKKSTIPGRLMLVFFMKSGAVQKFDVEKEKAKEIFKRMKK